MSVLVDISVRLKPDMPVWPGSVGFHLHRTKSFANGDSVNVSRLDMDVHCGTHVESALHFLENGAALESLPLDVFVGPAHVANLPDTDVIGPDELEQSGIPHNAERVLLRTRNSQFWQDGGAPFRTDYAALSPDGATWVVERGIRLIGADYLSVQRFGDGPETHEILMRAGVAILEGVDLSTVTPGRYRLICLPLWVGEAEAAPARALLEPLT